MCKHKKHRHALGFGEQVAINDADGEEAKKPEDELFINTFPHAPAPSKQQFEETDRT